MAIRQLLFEKGEEMGIREKGTRLPENEVMENLKKNLGSDDTLIVKCGKSFWDVTAYPEIFEAGDEFRVEDLTSIDRKQMEKPEPPRPAFVEKLVETPTNPLTELYHRTDEEEEEEEPEILQRKTYYLRSKDIEALTLLHQRTRVEISALVREVFERGISMIAEEMDLGDLYAEAEQNVARGVLGKKKRLK